MAKIRVLVADDHAVLRAGLRLLINTQRDLEVVGETGDFMSTRVAVGELEPDVATIDLSMPGGHGIRLVEWLSRETPGTRLLVLSMHDDPAYVRMALAAGAAGYVMKKSADTELLEAIRTVAAGRTYSPRMTDEGAASTHRAASAFQANSGANVAMSHSSHISTGTSRNSQHSMSATASSSGDSQVSTVSSSGGLNKAASGSAPPGAVAKSLPSSTSFSSASSSASARANSAAVSASSTASGVASGTASGNSPGTAQGNASGTVSGTATQRDTARNSFADLSERERQVLLLVARGHTNQAIANQLFLSVKTIESYRARLMSKLGLRNRAELTQFAMFVDPQAFRDEIADT
jgi:DNA-binding NarL/FixJ family response regulator